MFYKIREIWEYFDIYNVQCLGIYLDCNYYNNVLKVLISTPYYIYYNVLLISV